MAQERWIAPLILACLVSLYFFGLSTSGLLAEDEPRYAWIGRSMAESHDWITPRLWNQPWFEKPALLYWMIGAGFHLGLGPETAARAPVAAMSIAFLCFWYWGWRRIAGAARSGWAVLLLGTSAGWIAFSQSAVTDLPLSVCFASAMLAYLLWLKEQHRHWLTIAAVFLGLAVLAKGLVPLVLAAPALLFVGRRWKELVRPWPVIAFLVTVLPWYLLAYWRNGMPFIEEFFLRHHFGRFLNDELQHVRPWWFYLVVLAAGLLPWTPLLGLLPRRPGSHTEWFLLIWFAFGFVFFSASANKLPGYILPLLPALTALLALRLQASAGRGWWLASCVLLLGLVPVAARLLPQALQVGLSRSGWPEAPWEAGLIAIVPAVLILWLERKGAATAMALTTGGAVIAAFLYLKLAVLPPLDHSVSARSVWREISGQRDEVCIEAIHRRYVYGLAYYAGHPLPDCEQSSQPLVLQQKPGQRPRLARRKIDAP